MKSIAIIGAGGHGKVSAEIAFLNDYDVIDFYDDSYTVPTKVGGWKLCGNINDLFNVYAKYDCLFIAIGNNQIRAYIYEKFAVLNVQFAKLIHPRACVSRFSNIGSGSIVMANVVVNPETTISKGCILNTSSSIDHDCFLEPFVHICPGANLAGNIVIGQKSWIGIGSNIIQNIKIGKNTLIGAGSTVTSNLTSNIVAYGTPAKFIRENFK